MSNKISIVTGANSGIGKVTATALAKRGDTVVMMCRNRAKAEAARQEIIQLSGNSQVEIIQVDFASQRQIRQAAAQFLNQYNSLDVLVNNAGFLASDKRQLTEDGIEATFAVNHLGYFLLTGLLMPALEKAAAKNGEARVVCVASEAHRYAPFRLDNLQLERGYSGIKAYCISKLCNILFAAELARRTTGKNIYVNSLHPGAVNSGFADSTPGWFAWLFKIAKPFLISAEEGAATAIYLATAPEVKGISGGYFYKNRLRRHMIPIATDAQVARQLWEISEQLTGFRY
ncbi:MAG: SDR family oxidoreductase [Cytophagales bacterium]|nr:SDR family oxidoreductase [Bernardetiaceae bacterium]MDW8203760.1 SDR family oxidoreductase [Cytophagales bacterium]